MTPWTLVGITAVVLAALADAVVGAQPRTSGAATVFEGARLIAGDGRDPLQDSTVLVAGGRIVAVGRRGAVAIPEGAVRVDVTGKTIMPALIDAHSHIGYQRGTSTSVENYTRENIIDHLHRFAFYGVAATQSMGSDFGDLPYAVRSEMLAGRDPDAARFLTAGRGLAPLSEIDAANMRHAAFVVTTEEGARANVRELAARGVTLVKTWVRAEPKMSPALYGALIDEAHRHNLRVAVHATALADAKPLLRAGVDIFAHMLDDVDDEVVELFAQHPRTVVIPALSAPRLLVHAPYLTDPVHPLLAATVPPAHITMVRERLAGLTSDERRRAQEAWERLARGVRRLNAAGVKLGLGTDGGGQNGGYVGWTAQAELENLVAAGLSPMDVIVLATRDTAEILRLDELGTLTVGKSADFIVLDANPLEDITNARRISRVYLRGHQVDREGLAARWKAAMH